MNCQIKLNNGLTVLVSEEDYEYVSQFNWSLNNKGYIQRTYGNTKLKMHREIANRMGLDITNKNVDHISRDKLDNRRCNLRLASSVENNWNRNKATGKKGLTSQYKGVYKSSKHSWRARITYLGKQFNLGMYKTEEEAALAYNLKAIELFGNFAKLNDVSN